MDRLQREREAFKRDQLRALEKPKSTAPRKRKAAEPAASPRYVLRWKNEQVCLKDKKREEGGREQKCSFTKQELGINPGTQ